VHSFAGRLLFLWSGNDEAVPLQTMVNFAMANERAEFHLLAGTNHELGDEGRKLFMKNLMEWALVTEKLAADR
jgi:hypothetical protein